MNDYISREAAADIIADVFRATESEQVEMACIEINTQIKQVPAADVVEVRHGRWLRDGARSQNRQIVKCSICGNYLYLGGLNGGRGDANYCPNCGAKMDGGAES